MSGGWNPLTDGFPNDLFQAFEDREDRIGGKGEIEPSIARDPKCGLKDDGHDFGMVNRVEVERDTNLCFHLTCGCMIVLDSAMDGVIEVRK